jgi:hypothetical protein
MQLGEVCGLDSPAFWAGGATDRRAAIEKVMKGLAFLQGDVLGVLLYGSWATG